MDNTEVAGGQISLTSEPFVGKWHHLVSTTNWEKGRIIWQWREVVIAAEGGAAAYSDEAWARRVGGITAQHVGRLRRVYERFGKTSGLYNGLYWSHFYAALDWDDAEMWLEGAVQNDWTVSRMRLHRSDTLARAEGAVSQESEGGLAKDNNLNASLTNPAGDVSAEIITPRTVEVQPADTTAIVHVDSDSADHSSASADSVDLTKAAASRIVTALASLPEDVMDAFEAFKLAILRHKADGWKEVSVDDVVQTLDALKELALHSPSTHPSE